jgi:hypothetical protein
MSADGAEDIRVALNHVEDLIEFPDPGANREHEPDPCRFGARDHLGQIFGEARIIEVAMTVDDVHAG